MCVWSDLFNVFPPKRMHMLIFLNVIHVCLHTVSHLSCLFQCPSGVRSTAGLGDRMFAPVWPESPSDAYMKQNAYKHTDILKHIINMIHSLCTWRVKTPSCSTPT